MIDSATHRVTVAGDLNDEGFVDWRDDHAFAVNLDWANIQTLVQTLTKAHTHTHKAHSRTGTHTQMTDTPTHTCTRIHTHTAYTHTSTDVHTDTNTLRPALTHILTQSSVTYRGSHCFRKQK